MGKKKIIVDSNVLVALFLPDDSLHKKATTLVKTLKEQENSFLSINLVLQETSTVLSMRKSMETARIFYAMHESILDSVISVDGELERRSWEVFLVQTKKGSSFVDCAILAAVEKYKLDGIFSFDTFYPKELRVQ
ncbi:type II toxin-antitoxin system VapC family toxin [Candidatus Gottesmanbacteria bacterium]|nr:type II toxin-antitoxin system VapC family toxin [Candidatus Gottesmanbacteria bacterium]